MPPGRFNLDLCRIINHQAYRTRNLHSQAPDFFWMQDPGPRNPRQTVANDLTSLPWLTQTWYSYNSGCLIQKGAGIGQRT